MRNRAVSLCAAAALLVFVLACSSASNSGGTGGNGTPGSPVFTLGGGNSNTTQYMAAIDASVGSSGGTQPVTGAVTMDPTGQGTLTLKTGLAFSNTRMSWCNFPGATGCFDIGTFTADSAGNVNTTFTFPQHGTFAGVFGFTGNGVNVFDAGWDIPNGSTPFQASLVPAASVTAGLGAEGPIGNDTLTSGLVTIGVSSSTAHLTVQGVIASQRFDVSFCFNGGGSNCFALGAFTADATGNGSFDVDMSLNGPGPGHGFSGVFIVRREAAPNNAPIEYISAFKVP